MASARCDPHGYLPFVIARRDHESRRRQGVFQARSDPEYAGALPPGERATYDEIYKRFRHHPRTPLDLSSSSTPHGRNVALSGFKVAAHDHIHRMHVLASILQCHGIAVEIPCTQRLGYVVHEDDHQVAAEPLRDGGA
jgi:hypothetical protein